MDGVRMDPAREELRQSRELYRSLIEACPDAVTVVDLQAKITMASRRTAEIHGFSGPEEMVGCPLERLFAPEDVERARADAQRALQTGGFKNAEYTLLRKDGSRFIGELSVSVMRDGQGRPHCYMGVTRDITDRKEAEERLRERERNRVQILDSMPDPVLVVDKECRVLLANKSLKDLHHRLGLSTDLVGKLVPEVWPRTSEKLLTEFRSVFSTGLPVATEETHRFGEAEVSAEITKLPLIEGGRVSSVMAVMHDVSAQKKYARMLEERNLIMARANEQLQRLHQQKDEFIATVSHELRTPLVSGLGYVEMAMNGELGQVAPEVRDGLAVALRNLKHLTSLVDEVLEYQKLLGIRGAGDLAIKPCDLRRLLTDCTDDFRGRHPEAKRHLALEVADRVASVLCDQDRVRQVVANLLNNAALHAGKGATITLAAKPAAGGVQVTVSDTGAGMSEELRRKALEPFVKAPGSKGGSGLGLNIVKRILDAHETKWTFESAPGRGTTVSFSLPTTDRRPEGRAAQAAQAEHAHAHKGGRKRILVVEDHPDTVEFLRQVLAHHGYEPALAASAEEAMKQVVETVPDLAIIDVGLPGMDGVELCRRLKGNLATSEVPVCILTARAEQETRTRAEAAGCDGFVIKPVVIGEFLAVLKKMLEGGEGKRG
jgi:PAS domain S-box-containing protein